MQITTLSRSTPTSAELAPRLRAAATFTGLIHQIGEAFPGTWRDSELQAVSGEAGRLIAALSSASGECADLHVLEQRLEELYLELEVMESGLECSKLRQFSSRLESCSGNALADPLAFYAFLSERAEPSGDRIDKMDYLVTRLGEELRSAAGDQGTCEYRELMKGLWSRLGQPDPTDEAVRASLEGIAFLREQVVRVDSLEQLNDENAIQHYRRLKKDLGLLRFEPSLALATLDANLHFKTVVDDLYTREESSLWNELRAFDALEGSLAATPQIRQLRKGIRVFTSSLETQGLRIEEVAALRKQARAAAALLRGSTIAGDSAAWGPRRLSEAVRPVDSSRAAEAPQDADLAFVNDLCSDSGWLFGALQVDLVRVHLETILSTLAETDWDLSEAALAETPVVSPLGLLPREIAAYRRLIAQSDCANLFFEWLIVECSAVRLTVSDTIDEVQKALGQPHLSSESAIFDLGRESVSLANLVLGQLEYQIHDALQGALVEEAQALRDCREALLQEYSSLRSLLEGNADSRTFALTA